MRLLTIFFFFFFNDTATTEIYTLSLHDALPIFFYLQDCPICNAYAPEINRLASAYTNFNFYLDRKSTRLNSSHSQISYAVFCLKKKKKYCAEYIYPDHSQPVSRSVSSTKSRRTY